MKDEVKGKGEGRKGKGFHPLALTLLPFACSLSSFRLHPSSLFFRGRVLAAHVFIHAAAGGDL